MAPKPLAAFAFLVALVSAHATPMPEQAPGHIVVGCLKGPTGLGMVRLIDGVQSVRGASVAYELAASPDLLASRVLSGELDFAVLPTSMAAKLSSSGVPYRLAAIVGFGVLYAISSEDSVVGWEGLKGRTIAAAGQGSTADVVLRLLMRRHGIDPAHAIRYYPPVELAQLAIAGREPVAVLPEPFATKVMMQRPAFHVVLDIEKEWRIAFGAATPLAMSSLVVKAETAASHPALVAAFLQEVAASSRWTNEHPREAGLLAEKHGLGFSAAEAEAAIPRCNIRYVGARQARPEVQAFLSALLSSAPGSIGDRLPGDGFYLEE